MQFKTPKVFHLASTRVDKDELGKYLDFLGNANWHTDLMISDAELLTEVCGRRCYLSFGTELNPNITKVREGNKDYIANLLKTQHGSVVEHASDTFAFENVSRVFTHELVRHRLASYSQESMRFVRPTSLSTIFPSVYTEHLDDVKAMKVNALFRSTFEYIEDVQQQLIDICGMDDPKTPFNIKKLFQSANRRLIPDGVLTGIITTFNHRTGRFVIQQRTSEGAEEEIRYVYHKVFNILHGLYPNLYQDATEGRITKIYDEHIRPVTFANHKI